MLLSNPDDSSGPVRVILTTDDMSVYSSQLDCVSSIQLCKCVMLQVQQALAACCCLALEVHMCSALTRQQMVAVIMFVSMYQSFDVKWGNHES